MFKSILVAIDLNDTKGASLVSDAALRMARDHGADLHLINVLPDYGMSIVGSFFSADQTEAMIRDERNRFKDWASATMPDDVTYDLTVVKGHIYDNILKTADKIGADLIVVGCHKPELEDYLLGPNAARVVRHARQSVFVVRG